MSHQHQLHSHPPQPEHQERLREVAPPQEDLYRTAHDDQTQNQSGYENTRNRYSLNAQHPQNDDYQQTSSPPDFHLNARQPPPVQQNQHYRSEQHVEERHPPPSQQSYNKGYGVPIPTQAADQVFQKEKRHDTDKQQNLQRLDSVRLAPGQTKAVNVVKVSPKPEKNAYGGYGPVFKIEAPVVITQQQSDTKAARPPETLSISNQLKAPSKSPSSDSGSNYVPSVVSRSYENFMENDQLSGKLSAKQQPPSKEPNPPIGEDLAASMNDLRIQEAHQYAQKYSAISSNSNPGFYNAAGEGVVRAPRHPYDPVDEDDDDSSEGIDVDAPTPPPSVSRSHVVRSHQPAYPVTSAFSYHKPPKQQLRKIPEATQM